MKNRTALLAKKITIEQAIQAIEAKANNRTLTHNPDGSLCVSIPISPTDLKQMASLRVKLAQTKAMLGPQKSRKATTTPSSPTPTQTPDLLTEQMLAQRWHCSTSRLQRWRATKTGPAYMKIGGKVLYRLKDIYEYEAANVIKTTPKA